MVLPGVSLLTTPYLCKPRSSGRQRAPFPSLQAISLPTLSFYCFETRFPVTQAGFEPVAMLSQPPECRHCGCAVSGPDSSSGAFVFLWLVGLRLGKLTGERALGVLLSGRVQFFVVTAEGCPLQFLPAPSGPKLWRSCSQLLFSVSWMESRLPFRISSLPVNFSPAV